jgi:hypothetical protein
MTALFPEVSMEIKFSWEDNTKMKIYREDAHRIELAFRLGQYHLFT